MLQNYEDLFVSIGDAESQTIPANTFSVQRALQTANSKQAGGVRDASGFRV